MSSRPIAQAQVLATLIRRCHELHPSDRALVLRLAAVLLRAGGRVTTPPAAAMPSPKVVAFRPRAALAAAGIYHRKSPKS